MKVESFDFSRYRALKSLRIWTPVNFNPGWLCAAISSIPKPSNSTPRVPPLRIGIHAYLPHWMAHPENSRLDIPTEIDKIVNSWIPVDSQLSHLMGPSPDLPSTTSVPGGTTAGITLDVSIPNIQTGPCKGVAALMFPMLSDTKGLLRLV